MTPTELDAAFKAGRPYRGLTLHEHLGDTLFVSDADLRRASEGFLKTMTTWIFRSFRTRRGKPVPLGEIARFVHPDETRIDLMRTIVLYFVGILRKRGLREYDMFRKSPAFDEMVRAFDKASSLRR